MSNQFFTIMGTIYAFSFNYNNHNYYTFPIGSMLFTLIRIRTNEKYTVGIVTLFKVKNLKSLSPVTAKK